MKDFSNKDIFIYSSHIMGFAKQNSTSPKMSKQLGDALKKATKPNRKTMDFRFK